MSNRTLALLTGSLLALPMSAATAADAPKAAPAVTLEQIMANADWIGHAPENAYWNYDSKSIYYSQERNSSPLSDLYQQDLTGGAARKLADADLAGISATNGDINHGRTFYVFI